MIRLSQEKFNFKFNDEVMQASAVGEMPLYKDGKFSITVSCDSLDSLTMIISYPDVKTNNIDELRNFVKSELDNLSIKYSKFLNINYKKEEKIIEPEKGVIVNPALYLAVEKVVLAKDSPEYTKERIIDYLEKVLIVYLNPISMNETDEKKVEYWKSKYVEIKKELDTLKGVKK